MSKNIMVKNNIGAVIQYFRKSSFISQSQLGKGICSVATLSRIEAGERDADSLLLETLLERLGKTCNQFELILTEDDYALYQSREAIKKQLSMRNYREASHLLEEYEKEAAMRGSVHKQFIGTCKALLNEISGKDVLITIDLLMEAFSYTVPDFKDTNICKYHLSYSELSIITDIVDRMITAGIIKKAREIILQVLDYLDNQKTTEENNYIYTRAALLAGRIYLREHNPSRALEMCNRGIEKTKGSRKMDYIGELYLIKAKSTENLLKLNYEWSPTHKECLKLYLLAYYMLDFCEDRVAAEEIKCHLKEEYQWADIG